MINNFKTIGNNVLENDGYFQEHLSEEDRNIIYIKMSPTGTSGSFAEQTTFLIFVSFCAQPYYSKKYNKENRKIYKTFIIHILTPIIYNYTFNLSASILI